MSFRSLLLKIFFAFLFLTNLNAELFISFGGGYRVDSLNWNIAGQGGVPSVLSELKWTDLRMGQISLCMENTFDNCVLLGFEGDYARIFHGNNRDSDYLGSHRTLEFSRSLNSANKGEAFDLSVYFGYKMNAPFNDCFHNFEFCPKVGYSHHEQHLSMHKGFQALDVFDINNLGPFAGLKSSYRARWFGPWVGFDAAYEMCCKFKIFGSFQYHFARYNGKGHWNLRSDLADDFQHHGWAHGFLSRVGAQYEFDSGVAYGIQATYLTFKLRDGRDRIFFFDEDGSILVSGTKLNQVNWHSFRIEAYLSYRF